MYWTLNFLDSVNFRYWAPTLVLVFKRLDMKTFSHVSTGNTCNITIKITGVVRLSVEN